ncbi:MAG TPA: hypothetical protein VK422_14795 [Pyrinomonadaceae bacterium]|nr:hypothetical protein [Pyrinomonadaceae bacterium]
MWLYLVIILVAFCVAVLILLIVRFVQPKLIYAIRQAVVNIMTNRAFLDADEESEEAGEAFRELLAHDRRIEAYDYDEKYVTVRVHKIRQLYRILIRKPPHPSAKARKPQECIVELADLVGNLGWHVTPDKKFNYHSTVEASAILAFIRDQIEKGVHRLGTREADEVDDWFVSHPISIEQAIEILNAAVFALAYRQSVQGASAGPCDDRPAGGGDAPAAESPVAGRPLGLAGYRPHDTAEGGDAAEPAPAGAAESDPGGRPAAED